MATILTTPPGRTNVRAEIRIVIDLDDAYLESVGRYVLSDQHPDDPTALRARGVEEMHDDLWNTASEFGDVSECLVTVK